MLYLIGHIVGFLVLAAVLGFGVGWVLRGRKDARTLSRHAVLMSLLDAMDRSKPVEADRRRLAAEADAEAPRRLEEPS